MLTDDYKDTPQGPVPIEWNTTPLESLVETRNGLWKGKKAPFRSSRVIRNINFNNDGTLDLSNVAELDVQINQFESRQLLKGDIILERSGGGPSQPVGRVVFFNLDELDFSFSNFTTRLRVVRKPDVESKYLLYYLLHFYREGYTNALQSRTTGIRNLNFTDYKKIQIPLPPLPEQRAIAHVLTTVRQAIESTEKVIAAARELKRSMTKHLFTYGPVPIDQADQAPLKETEIGEVPEMWELSSIDDLLAIDLRNGIYKPRKFYGKGKVCIIQLNDMYSNEGRIEISRLDTLEVNENERLSYEIHTDDFVINRVSKRQEGVGAVAVVGKVDRPVVFESNMFRVRVNNSIIDNSYFYHFGQSDIYRTQAINKATKANQTSINQGALKSIRIPLPSIETQQDISKSVSTIGWKFNIEESRKVALQALFNSLLHHLMTGKVRVNKQEGFTSKENKS